jgi:molybdopterin adenylyltransferase
MRVAVLTVSDSVSAGTRTDASGPAAVAWMERAGHTLVEHAVTSDDAVPIAQHLLRWCDQSLADLVLTTGGTGLAPRDTTPEVVRALVERDAPALMERVRAQSLTTFPRAALARGVAGVRHRTLILTLPGSPGGVRDALDALNPILTHAIAILRDESTDHSTGRSAA